MKDQAALLELMINQYESDTDRPLSPHDPIFHTFVAVSHVGDIISTYGDIEARERYIATARRRSSVLTHASALGYTPRFLEPDRHRLQIVFSGAIPEDITIRKGQRIRTPIEDGTYTVAESLQDHVIPKGTTEYSLVEVEVGSWTSVPIGTGTGNEESFPLYADYVYVGSLYLEVYTPLGKEIWTLVDDFKDSYENDRHFIIEVGAKSYNDLMQPNDLVLYIRCGNGVNGKVFPADSEIFAVYKEVSPYTPTLPLGVLTEWEDTVPYVASVSNVEVTKEKVLPEDIEVIRRNGMYTKSIGGTLVSKIDFERAAIVQSVDKISKAYAEASVVNNKNQYRIYVAGDQYPLPEELLIEVRDKMYTNYPRNLTDEYVLYQAPTKDGELSLDVIYSTELTQEEKDELTAKIKSTLADYIKSLDLGQTYSIPDMWKLLINLTDTDLKGLAYVQFTSVPPTLAPKEELKIPESSITVNVIS
jgi:hypothetical protein